MFKISTLLLLSFVGAVNLASLAPMPLQKRILEKKVSVPLLPFSENVNEVKAPEYFRNERTLSITKNFAGFHSFVNLNSIYRSKNIVQITKKKQPSKTSQPKTMCFVVHEKPKVKTIKKQRKLVHQNQKRI